MSLVDAVGIGSAPPSETLSPVLPSGLSVLAANGGARWHNQLTGRHVSGTVFCEDCGTQLIESGPRCELCDRELGGEAGR